MAGAEFPSLPALRRRHTWEISVFYMLISVWMEGGRDLIAVALDNGYYDQNHFIRDCRKYTGRVPSKITSPSLPVPPVL